MERLLGIGDIHVEGIRGAKAVGRLLVLLDSDQGELGQGVRLPQAQARADARACASPSVHPHACARTRACTRKHLRARLRTP